MEGLYIVHVDDDKDDAQWLTENFSLYSSIAVLNFPDAKSFINFSSNCTDKNPPCLFVVDLKLPDLRGLELVKKIKANALFDKIPIVVYTTSYSPAEKANCEKLNIELFKKPNSVQEWGSICKIMANRCKPSLINS